MGRRARGEGSVFPNKQRGGWTAKITMPDGRRVTASARTQQEAIRKLAALRRQRDKGLDPSRLTLAEYITDQWLPHKRRDGTRVNTIRGYETKCRAHIVPRLGHLRLREITARHVEAALRAMLEAGSSPRNAAHVRTVLSNALHDAERWHLVERNEAALAVPPRVETVERPALTLAQRDALYRQLDGHDWRALYMLAGTLGLRLGEALAVTRDALDLEAATLRVELTVRRIGGVDIYEPPKSRRSRRALPLTPELSAALRSTLARQAEARLRAGRAWGDDRGLVFTDAAGRGLPPVSVLRTLKEALRDAGLPAVTFHDLRHTASSVLAAAGVAPEVRAALLGHAHVRITQDVYTHVVDDSLRAAMLRPAGQQ